MMGTTDGSIDPNIFTMRLPSPGKVIAAPGIAVSRREPPPAETPISEPQFEVGLAIAIIAAILVAAFLLLRR